VVVDGAHNVEGVKAAIETWRNMFGKNPERVIFGCLRDKPAELMLGEIRKTGAELWGVKLGDSRGMNPLEWGVHPDRLWSCVDEALQEEKRDPLKGGTLILGSLVLVGEVLRCVGERAG
jgi:folylpolyglutamate synthase/dihydropteroate synthase